MFNWWVLSGGSLGFICGCMWGQGIGSRKGGRNHCMRGYLGSFCMALALGFIIPSFSELIGLKTPFLPGWLNRFVWTLVVAFLTGLPMGYRIGRAYMISLSYSRTPNVRNVAPSAFPAVIGAVIGLAGSVYLASIH